MLKTIMLATVAFVALSPAAHAEKQVTRMVKELSDFPDLEKKTVAICENEKVAKSDRLKKACADKQFPRVTKAGAYFNTGYGAELNTLIRTGS
jgi:hypothetical protein